MANVPWYATGDAADKKSSDELERQQAAREAATKGRLYRFWMKVGQETHITFVDAAVASDPQGMELPFVFYEHQLKINNDWKNWFTCLGEGCPLCESGDRPALVAAYTIIDHTVWTGKKGDVHKDERKLLMAKPAVNKMLRKAASKRGGSLRGWKCEVVRTTAESPNTGDDFDFEEQTELPEDMLPPNYIEMFTPKEPAELEKVLTGHAKPVESDDKTVKF